jgi:hypothetical protein
MTNHAQGVSFLRYLKANQVAINTHHELNNFIPQKPKEAGIAANKTNNGFDQCSKK